MSWILYEPISSDNAFLECFWTKVDKEFEELDPYLLGAKVPKCQGK